MSKNNRSLLQNKALYKIDRIFGHTVIGGRAQKNVTFLRRNVVNPMQIY